MTEKEMMEQKAQSEGALRERGCRQQSERV